MTSLPNRKKVTELPPEKLSLSTLHLHEADEEHVRLACQLSDIHNEVGEVAVLNVSMTAFSVAVETVFDEFATAFYPVRDVKDILLEPGSVVRVREAGGWQVSVIQSAFLLDAFSLSGRTDFVFGDEGQIFRSEGGSAWTQDDTDCTERLYGMHGTGPDNLWAVGGRGAVLRAEGRSWRSVDIGIGPILRTVLADGARVYVGGNGGVAGYLEDGEFVAIETGLDSDVLAICAFRGAIYFSDSDFGVHRLAGRAFEPVANLGYTYRLDSGEHWMSAACGEYIFQFDGSQWRGIELSYRDGYRAEPFDMSFME